MPESPILRDKPELEEVPPRGCEAILSTGALAFIAKLEATFGDRRRTLLADRVTRQTELDAGVRPVFPAETVAIRESSWTVAPIPADLLDRRVEITGPVDRKMVINALNSGARVFMADFEDSNSPTWKNVVEGQQNLYDAVRGTIDFVHPITGKQYRLNESPATLMVRPRGWHLEEANLTLGGRPVSASLFDFGLFFFHNAEQLVARGSGPYFYLPKLENRFEAKLWNDVFLAAQDWLGIPRGTIRATVLIETILAAFEMDEILYELREHSAGLNCGRWDYIFSFIKRFRNDAGFVLPDRDQVTMERSFLKAYVDRLIAVCHKRGIHAMGGMAAQIPIKNDEQANRTALDKVRADKLREAAAGHDGTWIAHPGLAPIAFDAFDAVLGEAPNQIAVPREVIAVDAADLLHVPKGTITEAGLRTNLRVGVQYLEAWLRGNGCVPLYHLMEDAATAEISRAQIWQWIRHGARLDDGRVIDVPLFREQMTHETNRIREEVGNERFETGAFDEASSLFSEMIENKEFDEFLTLPAYGRLLTRSR